VLWAAIGLLPAPAAARSVAVVLVAHRPHATVQGVERARVALVRSARLAGWEVPAISPADAAAASLTEEIDAARLGFTGNVRRLHEEADALMRAHDFAGAGARLEDAETLLRENLDLPLIVPWLAETRLRRGIVEWNAGDTVAARASLDRALSMDPGRRLTSFDAHPDLVVLLEEVRRERERRPHVTVKVAAGDVRARIVLDDVPVGFAPVGVEMLPGRHVLRAEAPGRRVAVTEVEVAEAGMPPIDLVLQESDDVRALRDLPDDLLHPGRPVADRLAILRAAVGADVALVGIVTTHRGRPSVVLQAVGPSGAGGRMAIPVASAGDAVPALLATDPGTRAVALASHPWISAPDPDEPGPREAPAWYTRWWVWAAGGVAAVGGAALVYSAAKPDAQRTFVGDPQVD